jgi:hypothetical protein
MVDRGWSVRDAERWAKGRARRKPSPSPQDPNIVAAADRLRLLLGTKVEIVLNRRAGGAGFIRIHFYSGQDLDRVYSKLTEKQR